MFEIDDSITTFLSEAIFHKLYGYLDDDQMQLYSNVFNRSETDPEIIILAQEVVNSFNNSKHNYDNE